MSDVIDLIINGIGRVFTILEGFEFLGTNMLTFSITLLIITAMIPVLLTLVKNTKISTPRSEKVERKEENDK